MTIACGTANWNMDTLRWVTVDRSVTGIALIASMVIAFVLASLCTLFEVVWSFNMSTSKPKWNIPSGLQFSSSTQPGGYFQELEVAYAERVEKEVAMQTEARRLKR